MNPAVAENMMMGSCRKRMENAVPYLWKRWQQTEENRKQTCQREV